MGSWVIDLLVVGLLIVPYSYFLARVFFLGYYHEKYNYHLKLMRAYYKEDLHDQSIEEER